MSVVAVINTKGGCGKSTVATTLASWYAHCHSDVMIGDLDKQKSIRIWLKLRPAACATIHPWEMDLGKVFPSPPRTVHAVLDTPSGLDHYMLSKLLMFADALIVPVGPSLFDIESTKMLLATLLQHRKVRIGRCPVALVGMRWPANGSGLWRLRPLQSLVPVLTVISEDEIYPELIEAGLGLFDAQETEQNQRCKEWMPLLQWLDQVWRGDSTLTTRTLPPSASVAM